ncbi:hypothetical protein NQ317_018393 [Molorchus minor]|uniref:N-acetyltransferase domain-containing protein n=1 Tax=Molorchus minor TaxID=1323400 RepID=A0ABQ9J652_9CUCU|nr:hypothetical protein NQ317_018393 [Molorchus minor]
MAEVHHEILMNIPDEDLEKLADMYKEHGEIPYASSILTNAIKIRKKRSFLIRFMSTGNCWRNDGTFFALMEFPHSYDLVVCTLDKTCKNVYEGLMRTKRLHFHRPLVFFAVHNTIYPTILKVIEDRKLRVKSDNAYYIYSISRKEAINFKLECPEEVEIRTLCMSHAALINSLWPLKFPHSDEFLASLIEMNGGYGLFMKSTNELVSWALKTGIGQIGVVQTVESYQKKGFASVVTRILARKIAEEDEDPTATIAVSNVTSQNMFKKLGFTNRGLCNYITLKKIVI